jgi:hypothetical protein
MAADFLYATCDSYIPTPTPPVTNHGTQKVISGQDERNQDFISSSDSHEAQEIDDFNGTPNHSFHNLYSSMSEYSEERCDLNIQSFAESSAQFASPLLLDKQEDLHQENVANPSRVTTNLKLSLSIRANEIHHVNADQNYGLDVPVPSTHHFQGLVATAKVDGVHVSRPLDGSKIIIGQCEPNHPLHQSLPSWARGESSGGRRDLITILSHEVCPEPWQESESRLSTTAGTLPGAFRRRKEPWDLARIDLLKSYVIDDGTAVTRGEENEYDRLRYSLRWNGPRPSLLRPGEVNEPPTNLMECDPRDYVRPVDQPIQYNDHKTLKVSEAASAMFYVEAAPPPAQEKHVEVEEAIVPAHASLPERYLSKVARSAFNNPVCAEFLSSFATGRAALRPTRIPPTLPQQVMLGPSLDDLSKNNDGTGAIFWHGHSAMGAPISWELGEFFTAPPSKREVAVTLKRINTSTITGYVRDVKNETEPAPASELLQHSKPTAVVVVPPTEPQPGQIEIEPIKSNPQNTSADQHNTSTPISISAPEAKTSNVLLKFDTSRVASATKSHHQQHRRRNYHDSSDEPLKYQTLKLKIPLLTASTSHAPKIPVSTPGLPPPPPPPPPPPTSSEIKKNFSEVTIVEDKDEEDAIKDDDNFKDVIPKQSSAILASLQCSPSHLAESPINDSEITFVDDEHKMKSTVPDAARCDSSDSDSEPYKSPLVLSLEQSPHCNESVPAHRELSISISGGEDDEDDEKVEQPLIMRMRTSVSIDEDARFDDIESKIDAGIVSQQVNEPVQPIASPKALRPTLRLVSSTLTYETRSVKKAFTSQSPKVEGSVDDYNDLPINRLTKQKSSSKSPVISRPMKAEIDASSPSPEIVHSKKRLRRLSDVEVKGKPATEREKKPSIPLQPKVRGCPLVWGTVKNNSIKSDSDDDIFGK